MDRVASLLVVFVLFSIFTGCGGTEYDHETLTSESVAGVYRVTKGKITFKDNEFPEPSVDEIHENEEVNVHVVRSWDTLSAWGCMGTFDPESAAVLCNYKIAIPGVVVVGCREYKGRVEFYPDGTAVLNMHIMETWPTGSWIEWHYQIEMEAVEKEICESTETVKVTVEVESPES